MNYFDSIPPEARKEILFLESKEFGERSYWRLSPMDPRSGEIQEASNSLSTFHYITSTNGDPILHGSRNKQVENYKLFAGQEDVKGFFETLD